MVADGSRGSHDCAA
jgi:hypothetical protein